MYSLVADLDAEMDRGLDEPLEDDEGWFVALGEFPGLWAGVKTVEQAREQSRGALEGWIVLAFRPGERLPTLNGINLTPEIPARHAS